jgi:hypothetical protein
VEKEKSGWGLEVVRSQKIKEGRKVKGGGGGVHFFFVVLLSTSSALLRGTPGRKSMTSTLFVTRPCTAKGVRKGASETLIESRETERQKK